MIGLLVSVRNAQEARDACAGGATLIDVKEPNNGSLGAANPRIWKEVRASVPTSLPTSVALGELLDGAAALLHGNGGDALSALADFQFAKVGLAGCQGSDWVSPWRELLRPLPDHIKRVAVAYADYSFAKSPPPAVIIDEARSCGCHAVLVDTFHKNEGNVFAHLRQPELLELARDVRASGMKLVIAGSITLNELEQACQLQPDFVAVRGAVCRGSREKGVDPGRVRAFASALNACANLSTFGN